MTLVCLATALLAPSVARAQSERSVPTVGYRAAFTDFYDGEYSDALDAFQAEGRGSIKVGVTRWIDSICYETMVGECYYHMGHLDKALGHYTAALNLFVANSDWMIRVQFPPAIQPSSTVVRIPWGRRARPSRLGHYPTDMLIARGRVNNNPQIKQGGVVQQAYLRPIQVQEVVRCTTLAIRRRAKLLGPVSRHDPLTTQVMTALARRPGPPNHWSEAWINVQYGLALLAAGREAQGKPYLERAIVAAGQYDHPLTSTALLELGRLALVRGDFPVAKKFFEEATFAAVYYPDVGVLEEAFRYAALTHLLSSNGKGIYPPLLQAVKWARVNDLRRLQTTLLLVAAENYAVLGMTDKAAGALDDAHLSIGRRQMGTGRIGAEWSYLQSLVFFQQQKTAEGDQALVTAMNYMQRGSYWLFHIKLADGLYTGGAIAGQPRIAMELYSEVLRDPQGADWSADPMEAMSVLLTPHPGPLERWFEVALKRNAHEKALEIADRARRHRFFSSLAFGGRLQSLRWILEASPNVLRQEDQLFRRDLLTRYPAYERLTEQVKIVRGQLRAMPLVVVDTKTQAKQTALLGQLAALSEEQEALMRQIALRREPAGLVFPPLRSVQEIQEAMPTGHAMLAFFATSRHLYGFLLNDRKYSYWKVGAPAALAGKTIGLLREMGHFQQNTELTVDDLADLQWKKAAADLLKEILRGSQADFTQPFDELVIVPDGVLWYVPFEALQVTVKGKSRPLIGQFRIRYAPTASLATSMGHGRKPTGNTAVVVGRLFPRDDESIARAAFDQLAAAIPGTVALKTPSPAPSAIYGSLFDRLIVLDDLNLSGTGPYAWAPDPIDRGKAGSTLSDWLRLPWGAPDEIILPGYHTASENSLKQLNSGTPGEEVFLSICGLMSSGSRTLLLSRWRTGGQTSFDAVREFAQELPHAPPAEAWQRSVFLTAGSQVNIPAEPRIKRTANEKPLRANHPFFWAGYMLVDSGAPPKKPDPGEGIPPLRPDLPALRPAEPDPPAAGQ
ncbi:MAG: CHAT domain-containing protein [Candidatus Nealsonbacteria bacterium]|nr:CHAT domain-containing protein [Candidatus Nealsonbacteria bacterium]